MRNALQEIRRVHRDEEAKLSLDDRVDLARAMQLLAIAGMLEAELLPLDVPS